MPLDGSMLAECVLPHVEAFIEEYHVGNIVFVRIVEPAVIFHSGEYPISPEVLRKSESASKSAATDYLDQIVNQFKREGTELQSEVLLGSVAASLVDFAERNDVDLILIATHGRSGVRRWVRRSIADKILHSSTAPVLIVRGPGSEGES
ncbi:MAG: universal stress protein [Desulfobacterales bacterium]|nr:universal stress protein [Desulfobacterales bacterium]